MSLQTSTSFMPEKTENPKRKCPEDAGYGDYADRPYRFFPSASLPASHCALVSNRQHHLFPIPGNA